MDANDMMISKTAAKTTHDALLRELADTYRKKNSDYGGSFHRSFSEFGISSGMIRISDKYYRALNLSKKPEARKVMDESLRDTLMDMANYCILTVLEMENKQKGLCS